MFKIFQCFIKHKLYKHEIWCIFICRVVLYIIALLIILTNHSFYISIRIEVVNNSPFSTYSSISCTWITLLQNINCWKIHTHSHIPFLTSLHPLIRSLPLTLLLLFRLCHPLTIRVCESGVDKSLNKWLHHQEGWRGIYELFNSAPNGRVGDYQAPSKNIGPDFIYIFILIHLYVFK